MLRILTSLPCQNFKIRCVCPVLVVALFVGGILINRLSKNNLTTNILKFSIRHSLTLILMLIAEYLHF